MKKIIMLSALTLCICMAGFANGTHHAKKKITRHQQKTTQAYMNCYYNFDTSETCTDGSTMITGVGTITYDCMSGAVTDFFYFQDPNGCGFLTT